MFAKVNGTRIFFDVHGLQYEPSEEQMLEKPVTFVLHGGPGMDHTYFLPWVKPLEDYTQMIFVDHRSTGRSDGFTGANTWNIEQFADDVEELRKYLGLEKICLMGSSFGGMWSLVYATRYPYNVDRLVLVDTAPSWDTWAEAQQIAQKKATDKQKKVLADVFVGKVRTAEEQRAWFTTMFPLYFYKYNERIGKQTIARTKGSPMLAAHMFREIIPKYDVRNKLWMITAPTLVIVGRHDWITPVSQSEEIARLIPSAKLEVFEKSGHMPFIEEKAKFINTVGKFLRGNPPSV